MERYFVCQLLPDDYRPSPTAEYEIQVLNGHGQGEVLVFLARDGTVLSALHAKDGPIDGPTIVDRLKIPPTVIAAALASTAGYGEYVDAAGRIVHPMGGW